MKIKNLATFLIILLVSLSTYSQDNKTFNIKLNNSNYVFYSIGVSYDEETKKISAASLAKNCFITVNNNPILLKEFDRIWFDSNGKLKFISFNEGYHFKNNQLNLIINSMRLYNNGNIEFVDIKEESEVIVKNKKYNFSKDSQIYFKINGEFWGKLLNEDEEFYYNNRIIKFKKNDIILFYDYEKKNVEAIGKYLAEGKVLIGNEILDFENKNQCFVYFQYYSYPENIKSLMRTVDSVFHFKNKKYIYKLMKVVEFDKKGDLIN